MDSVPVSLLLSSLAGVEVEEGTMTLLREVKNVGGNRKDTLRVERVDEVFALTEVAGGREGEGGGGKTVVVGSEMSCLKSRVEGLSESTKIAVLPAGTCKDVVASLLVPPLAGSDALNPLLHRKTIMSRYINSMTSLG